MNWNIIIPITFIFTNIILAWFCYQLGCRTVKPIENNNQAIKDENLKLNATRQDLQDKIDLLIKKNDQTQLDLNNIQKQYNIIQEQYTRAKKDLSLTEEKKRLIDQSNLEAQNFIQQSERLAKEKADAIYKKELTIAEQNFEKTKLVYQDQLLNFNNEIQKTKKELDSLKNTRAAVINAARQEKQIQENKDEYCLILSPEELGDVNTLRAVAKKISKPRSIYMAIWSAYYQPIAKKKFPQILGGNEVCGIYKITNQQTGECYIGQARNCYRRWFEHSKAGLSIDTPQGNQLYSAMIEYGLDEFSFELLEECKPEELDEKEKYFIELYQSNIVGYNIVKGNNG